MKVGRLTITAGPPEGRELFPLADISVFEIGRAPGSHIRLSDESVSINHCRIFRRGEEYTLYALSEIKPTTLNGKDAKRAPIQHGDRIGIGAYELAFELLEPADAATPNPQLRRAAPNPPPGAPNDAAAAPPTVFRPRGSSSSRARIAAPPSRSPNETSSRWDGPPGAMCGSRTPRFPASTA